MSTNKKYSCFCLIIVLIICTLAISCQHKKLLTMDNSLFIMDDYAILLLCEPTPEDNEYTKLISNLKGNDDELKAVIDDMEIYNDSVKFQNAIGVAYLRLREINKAEQILSQALQNAASEDEQVCILTNLSETASYKENHEERYRYALSASEKCVSDPIKKLAVESNLLRIQVTENANGANSNVRVKRLLRDEKKLLGSNQLIGIQNYKLLALGCYYDDQFKNSIYYISKALELNENLYKNPSIESNLYNTFSFIYLNQSNSKYYTKALDYANRYVNVLENWQTADSYDLLNAYEWRGNIMLKMGDADSALKDYALVLERRNKGHVLTGVSYYNMGYAYIAKDDTEKAINAFSKAYIILKTDNREKDTIENIRFMMKSVYETNKYESQGMEFEEWFDTQINIAEREMSEEENAWME